MAKQRRAKPRPVRKPAQPLRAAPAAAAPPIRARYLEAVALYEQGVSALQTHEFSRASTLLRSVLSGYPDEKELHERVRLYLNICERQTVPPAGSPRTPEERVFAATLACNAGDYDSALAHLRVAAQQAPDNDNALYMLAAVLALRGDTEEAATNLVRAIELNPENRPMARHDADLESLRDHPGVRAALEAAPPAKPERRRSSRRSR